jgi:hypothetical protein
MSIHDTTSEFKNTWKGPVIFSTRVNIIEHFQNRNDIILACYCNLINVVYVYYFNKTEVLALMQCGVLAHYTIKKQTTVHLALFLKTLFPYCSADCIKSITNNFMR